MSRQTPPAGSLPSQDTLLLPHEAKAIEELQQQMDEDDWFGGDAMFESDSFNQLWDGLREANLSNPEGYQSFGARLEEPRQRASAPTTGSSVATGAIGDPTTKEYWLPIDAFNFSTPRAKAARQKMSTHMKNRRKITVHDWQLDVGVAIEGGHDTLAIAATGAGKSICYEQLGAIPDSTHIVISPIVILIEEQVRNLQSLGYTAVGLTADSLKVYKGNVWKDIQAAKFQYIVAAPEVLLNPGCEFWKNMVRDKEDNEFIKRLRSITVDECHMVWKWGGVVDKITQRTFRPEFAFIGNFRLLFPTVPFLLLSATVTPVVRGYLFEVMKLQKPSFICRQSLLRKNLRFVVGPTISSNVSGEFKELDFLVDPAIEAGNWLLIPKTIIYTDSRNKVQDIAKYLRNRIIRAMAEIGMDLNKAKTMIAIYTGYLDDFTRFTHMEDFYKGLALILICTEAAGMGLNIRDVQVVVQHRISRVLTAADVWQRVGRCCRDASIKGLGLCLVDDIDRLILHPEGAVINGFDYSMPVTPETIGEVRNQILTMYDEPNRKAIAGPTIDPGLLWLINTTGCRMRLLFALFTDPLAFDFSTNDDGVSIACQSPCDNCVFPTRTTINRQLPPKEWYEHEVNEMGPEQRNAMRIRVEKQFADDRNSRKKECEEQLELAKETIVHGFSMMASLRFRDTAAFERLQIDAEKRTIMVKTASRNNKVMLDCIKASLVDMRNQVCSSGDFPEVGLQPAFVFPDALITMIAEHKDIQEFAKIEDISQIEKQLDKILGEGTLDESFFAGRAETIHAAVKKALDDCTAELARRATQKEQDKEARRLQREHSRASLPRSRASTPGGSETGAIGTTAVDPATSSLLAEVTEKFNALSYFCPFCYLTKKGGHDAGTNSLLTRHETTDVHRKSVARVERSGPNGPFYPLLVRYRERRAAATTLTTAPALGPSQPQHHSTAPAPAPSQPQQPHSIPPHPTISPATHLSQFGSAVFPVAPVMPQSQVSPNLNFGGYPWQPSVASQASQVHSPSAYASLYQQIFTQPQHHPQHHQPAIPPSAQQYSGSQPSNASQTLPAVQFPDTQDSFRSQSQSGIGTQHASSSQHVAPSQGPEGGESQSQEQTGTQQRRGRPRKRPVDEIEDAELQAELAVRKRNHAALVKKAKEKEKK